MLTRRTLLSRALAGFAAGTLAGMARWWPQAKAVEVEEVRDFWWWSDGRVLIVDHDCEFFYDSEGNITKIGPPPRNEPGV